MKNKSLTLFCLLSCVLFFLTITHTLIGSKIYTLHTLTTFFTNYGVDSAHPILFSIRFPRTATVILLGSMLSVAGLLSQRLTKNPIATPQVLGLNAAVVFVIITIQVFFPLLNPLIPFFSLCIIGLIFSVVAFLHYQSNETLIKISLIGMMFGLVFTSLTQMILFSNEESQDRLFFWLVGGVNHAAWETVMLILPYALIGLTLSFLYRHSIEMLQFDEEMLKSLGVSIQKLQLTVIFIIGILTIGAVSFCGPIAFIGLITPHVVQRFQFKSFASIVLFNIIIGAIILLIADILAKLIFWPQEVYVGVMSALIGSIFFFFIILKQQGVRTDEK